MKDTFYFSHDFHARSDEKILKLLQKEKWEGYGLYWAIVEKLYEAGGWIEKDYDTIAYDLRTEYDRITRVIESYDLFIIKGDKITSKSVLDRIALREEKSNKARDNVAKRWAKVSEKEVKDDTTVLRNWYDRNTIKERKGKEIKIKESKTGTRTRPKKSIEEKPEKLEVENLVHLLPVEIESVKAIYGNLYKDALLKLSSHKASKGTVYRSDYATLYRGGWVYDYMHEKHPTLKSIQLVAEKKDTENDTKKIQEEKEKKEKEKVEAEYKIIREFYTKLSEDEKKQINARADFELSNFTQKMRESSGKSWDSIYGAKVRTITDKYKNTGIIDEVPDLIT